MGAIETRAVGPGELDDLARLFEQQRNTRHCWCTAFCVTRSQFAIGWLGGGNRRRFEAMAKGLEPMGILASTGGEPIGWCACGPRSRYLAATTGHPPVMRNRVPNEDESVWLLPCFVVRDGRRGVGVSHHLVRAAVELARGERAVAVEGWPSSQSARRPGDAYLGREQVFAELGFACTDRPTPDRAIMRLELDRP
jgi:hypothetical protein